MTKEPNFRELHAELTREFFFYADQKGRSYLDSLMLMYWQARGPAFVGAVANYPGTKFLVTTDDASALPGLIPKALMVADHVVIRHSALVPVTGLILGAVPVDFAGFGPIDWVEKHRDQLISSRSLPHYKSPPPPEDIAPFIDWLCSDGRPWFESGQVTYAPVLVPGETDLALLEESVNVSPLFRHANILPQDSRLLDYKAAAALAQLELPYLEAVPPDLLLHFKDNERDTLESFQRHLLQLVNRSADAVNSPDFKRATEEAALELRDQVHQLERSMESHLKSQTWRRVGVELVTLGAAVSFWLGLPTAGIAGLSAAAVTLAKSIDEKLKEDLSLRNNPVYFLARLGTLQRRSTNWDARVQKLSR